MHGSLGSTDYDSLPVLENLLLVHFFFIFPKPSSCQFWSSSTPLFLLLLLYFETGFLQSSDCPVTYPADRAGLELKEFCLLSFLSGEIKGVCHHAQHIFFIFLKSSPLRGVFIF